MEPGLNSLLQWGIENSSASNPNPNPNPTQPTQSLETSKSRGLNAQALAQLMGGPSDADLMREAMTVIQHPESTLESKATAFDNLEQLVESIDNANNLTPLGLWDPLVAQLSSIEAELRKMAAWCIGTAVQNNVKAQERLLEADAISVLCRLAVEDEDEGVRRKCVYALSSEIRNYQPGMNEVVRYLPKHIVGPDQVSASDMEVIDAIMGKLRDKE
jgi:hsp70-interacting protein